MNRTREGYKFYFNANTMEYAWERPKDVKKDYSILTREEIQVIQKSFVQREHTFNFFLKNFVTSFWLLSIQVRFDTILSAECHQFSSREMPQYNMILSGCDIFFLQTFVSEVTSAYDRELLFKSNEPFIIKLQSHVRGYLARKRFNERMNFMRTQLPAITKIQVRVRVLFLVCCKVERVAFIFSMGF